MRLHATLLFLLALPAAGADAPPLIRSAATGPWSAATTWEGGKVPAAGARVQVRTGHTVTYDVRSAAVLRSIHVAGTLSFARDRDTQLAVGLIKIMPGDDPSEDGFDCDAHLPSAAPGAVRPALEVGSLDAPLPAKYTALIRLTPVAGLDRESCPAIVCCGGRMDFHGAPLSHAWVKLGATAAKGSDQVVLGEAVIGWRVGDRILVTATKSERHTDGTRHPSATKRMKVQTEERVVRAVDGTRLTLDQPLEYEHLGTGDYRGEVANLSRNVVVESANPAGERGHTMYHRGSAGSIGYAEFRHLGKPGVLGRYSLHYHLCGDTMRGSSVVGASIWDSGNRWLTIHGTNYLVVRDCVGYQSLGHGFFLEDGTEVFNVLDRNLAVQACATKKLPKQALPFDANDGAGFWWANSRNTFTNNVACENDRYGFRFEATETSALKLTLPIQGPDGERQRLDIRTLPFVRFEGNEAHCDGRYGFNLGEGVRGVGPDERHPFVVRDMKIWEVHYAFRPQSPCLLAEGVRIYRCDYGVYHPNYDRHVYRNLYIGETNTEPFNRGHDDVSAQHGPLTVDGLTFDGIRSYTMPLVQISDNNPTGKGVTHLRGLKLERWTGPKGRAVVNLGGGPRPDPKTPEAVPVYVHDWFGPGRHARVLSVKAKEVAGKAGDYREVTPLTGDESRAVEVSGVAFPEVLRPVDDLPPTTVVTNVVRRSDGRLTVRGAAADDGPIRRVVVNGKEATANAANFAVWEAVVEAGADVAAHAEDAAGNVEKRPHVVRR